MRPNYGRTDRSQPPTIPATSAPPAVDSVSGTPAMLSTSDPNSAPITTNAPTNAMSVTSVARSATPSNLIALLVSCVRPTIVNRSPRVDRGGRQDRDVRRGRAARDLAQKDAARLRHLHQVDQRLAVERLVGDEDVDALDRHRQQLPILDLGRAFAEDLDEHVAGARDRHDIAFLENGIRRPPPRFSRCGGGAARRRVRQARAPRPR